MAAYYGHLVEEYRDRMDPDVLGLIEYGNSMSAVQLKRIEIERTDVWRRVAAVLADHDALICPTMATPPVAAAKRDRVPTPPPADGRYHAEDMTSVFNLVAPCPVLTVPAGQHADGVPIGVQIVGRRWQDDTVLRIGRGLEVTRPWAARRPAVQRAPLPGR